MSERCPHCSFDSTNSNDFCSLHKPGSVEMAKKRLLEVFQSVEGETGRRELMKSLRERYCGCGYEYKHPTDFCCCQYDD